MRLIILIFALRLRKPSCASAAAAPNPINLTQGPLAPCMIPLGPKPAAFWLAVRALRIEVGKTGIEPTLGKELSSSLLVRSSADGDWFSSRGLYVSHREAGERPTHLGYALGVQGEVKP